MKALQDMHHRIVSSLTFEKMLRSVKPMSDHFHINQFYYTKLQFIENQTYFSSIGTNIAWHEFAFDDFYIPPNRSTTPHHKEIIFQKLYPVIDPEISKYLETAQKKFNITFVVDAQRKCDQGIELFGFGLGNSDLKTSQYLLNHLGLVHKFINFFYEENRQLIHLAHDNQVNISTCMPPITYPTINYNADLKSNQLLLTQLGLASAQSLTSREMDILKFLANGFPASYIADKLHRSCRTVENYIANIKSKLHTDCKATLIEKAHEIITILEPTYLFLD